MPHRTANAMIRNEHASAPLARAVIPTLPASGGLVFMLVGLGFWAAFGLMLLAAAVKAGLCATIKAQLHHICIVQMCTPSRAHAETFYWVFNHVREINPFRTAGRQDTKTSHPDVALDVDPSTCLAVFYCLQFIRFHLEMAWHAYSPVCVCV